MKSLLVHLKNYKKESVFAPLFKMLEALFELFVPLVMAAVIDVGIAQSDRPYIIRMCFVLVALGMIGLVCSITAQYFAAKAAAGFGTGVRHALFEHIQKLTFSEMDEIGSSTLITRMTSDINQVQSGVNLVLRLFLRSPFIVFGAMIMAFTVDMKAALIFVVTIPILSVIVFGIMLITMPLYKKVQSDLDRVLLMTRENLTGVRVIRAFNKENDERERFEEGNQALTDAQKFVGRISGLMNPLTYAVVNGAIIVKRDLPFREKYLETLRLSEYFVEKIASGKSIWVAQKSGRSKDGLDVTHPSIVKMLHLAKKREGVGFEEVIKACHIVPVAVSYEYDPNDIAKAREEVLTQANGSYNKGKVEDVVSMIRGLREFKGRIHISIGDELTGDWHSPEEVAAEIDRQIHLNYHLMDTNWFCYDQLNGDEANRDKYPDFDGKAFLDRYAVLNDEVRTFILNSYANPVRSRLAQLG